jgi:transposase
MPFLTAAQHSDFRTLITYKCRCIQQLEAEQKITCSVCGDREKGILYFDLDKKTWICKDCDKGA